MRNVVAIAKKELYLYFATPVAWVAFFATSFIAAFAFLSATADFQRQSLKFMESQNPALLDQLNLTDAIAVPLLVNMGVILIFIAPFLTMRLVSEELRGRTMELLMTTPVRSIEIVLGKYVAVLVLVGFYVGLVAVYPAILHVYGASASGAGGIEWQTVGLGLFGLFLCGASFAAVGLFVSALTESQVVAALLTFLVLFLFWVVGWKAGEVDGIWRSVLAYLSCMGHLVSFGRGRLLLGDVVYYLSFITFGLFLAHRAIEARRWA